MIRTKCKTLFVILITVLCFQTPCFSVPWSGKRLPQINPAQKIDYVNICWWDNFTDPCLKYYIIQAIENNHDARKASWQVEEYRQNVKYQFGAELPTLSVGSDYVLNHLPDTIMGTKTNLFIVPFLSTYEADVFLKNHDRTKSSKKAYQSSKFQEQSVYISLASDVATTYINIIKYDKQICIQQSLVEVKKEELKREENRYKRGVSAVPKVNIAKQGYETAKSNLYETIKLREKALTQLAVLTGDSPDNIACIKRGSFDDLEYKIMIPCSISSDVIFSRPDVLAAESNLEKANIDVRVARKEFLPRFNIIGLYSFDNIGSGGFGTWSSTVAAFIAGATLDLFKGGQKVATLKINKARYEQMFEAYRQTDLTAIKEVNDSMLIIKEDTKIDENTCKNLLIQNDNYQRAAKSYKYGTISCPALLSEDEQLLNMQQNQVNTKAVRLIDYITLYKAVGGKL